MHSLDANDNEAFRIFGAVLFAFISGGMGVVLSGGFRNLRFKPKPVKENYVKRSPN